VSPRNSGVIGVYSQNLVRLAACASALPFPCRPLNSWSTSSDEHASVFVWLVCIACYAPHVRVLTFSLPSFSCFRLPDRKMPDVRLHPIELNPVSPNFLSAHPFCALVLRCRRRSTTLAFTNWSLRSFPAYTSYPGDHSRGHRDLPLFSSLTLSLFRTCRGISSYFLPNSFCSFCCLSPPSRPEALPAFLSKAREGLSAQFFDLSFGLYRLASAGFIQDVAEDSLVLARFGPLFALYPVSFGEVQLQG